jgi:hypothetical protein
MRLSITRLLLIVAPRLEWRYRCWRRKNAQAKSKNLKS